ncbi:MAG: hypothetical protein U0401_03755 [Anaerolineae bacterium]
MTALGTLATGAITSYTCSPANVTTSFTNTAIVTGTPPVGAVVTDTDDAQIEAIHPAITIAKTPDLQTITSGDTVTFTITVSNTGDADLSGVVVGDTLAPTCGRTIGTLTTGAITSYTCSLANVTTSFTNTAVVTGTPPVGSVVTDTDDAQVEVINPAIAITKTPDLQLIQSGDSVTFTITVSNTGDVDLTGVEVGDPLASNCDRTIGNLAIGAITSYTCSLANVTTDFTNTAIVTGTPPVGSVVTSTDDAIVEIIHPAIEIAKTPDTQTVQSGGPVTFTITVSNTGHVDLTGVVVSDPLALDCDYTIGALATGAITSYTCSLVNVTANFTNTAVVTGTPPVGEVVTDTDDAGVEVIHPAIAIAKTPDTQTVQSGDTVTFTITVSNTGDVDLSSVVVGDPLVSDCDRTLGTLATGAITSYTCSLANVTTSFTNTAIVTGTPPTGSVVTDTDDAQIEVIHPAIAIAKTPDLQTITSGDTVTFTITVSNTGDVDLTGVVVGDTLAPTCGRNIGTLTTGAITSYTCSLANVTADFTNTAVVTGTPPAGSVVTHTDTAQVDVTLPGIAIAKTPDLQTVSSGGTVTFTITVTNTGDVDLSSVVVGDTLAPACSRTIGTLTMVQSLPIPALPFSHVTADFTNTAIVTGTPPTGPNVNDTDDAVVDVVSPGLAVDKSVALAAVVPNQAVTYTIRVTNTGNVTLTTVEVRDTLPIGFVYVPNSATPAPSSTANGQLIWNDITGGLGLGPGQLALINFRVTMPATISTYINTAIVTGTHPTGVLTATDSVPVIVTDPAVAVEKDQVAPGVVNGLITFTIHITNTGPSIIDQVPLVDHFSGPIVYVGGTPPASTIDNTNQIIAWSDLTANTPNGFGTNLAPNQAFVITTVFSITGNTSSFTMTNAATVTNAVDIFNNGANDDSDTEVLINVPTAIDLLYFTSTQEGQGVRLNWATAVEYDNYGFRLLRSSTSNLADAIDVAFIPGQGHGTVTGATYTYLDQSISADQTYTYWLVDVDFNGVETAHNLTTAIHLSTGGGHTFYLPLIFK